ncbi:MAG TPA: hypothetical protein ENF23_05845 [Methanosarcinales archaeon]|nr:MAG: hypothetical protein DRO03_05390 [Methanosarcinales archaeon]HDN65797.1 hypothetical protein [Methanosarcinales archaeon]
MKGVYGFKVCPFCGGSVEYAGIASGHIFPAAHMGQMYLCNRCGYKGSFILEMDDAEEVKEGQVECQQLREAGKLKTPSFGFPDKWTWFWRAYLALLMVILVFGSCANLYGMFR